MKFLLSPLAWGFLWWTSFLGGYYAIAAILFAWFLILFSSNSPSPKKKKKKILNFFFFDFVIHDLLSYETRINVARLDGKGLSKKTLKIFKILLYIVSCLVTITLLFSFPKDAINREAYEITFLALYMLLIPCLIVMIGLFVFSGVKVLILIHQTSGIGSAGAEAAKQKVARNLTILMVVCLLGFISILGMVSYLSIVFSEAIFFPVTSFFAILVVFDLVLFLMLIAIFATLTFRRPAKDSSKSGSQAAPSTRRKSSQIEVSS